MSDTPFKRLRLAPERISPLMLECAARAESRLAEGEDITALTDAELISLRGVRAVEADFLDAEWRNRQAAKVQP